ncbi:MAG: amidohydrolase family protein [Bryobacteraceae bacterium]|nr:amidohydrolase family protein [Bryobacteraceae bacterium]
MPRICRLLPILAFAPLLAAPPAPLTLAKVGAIDAHAHIFVDDPGIRQMLSRLDLRFVNITVVDPIERGFELLEPQHRYALEVARAAAGRAPWVSTFDPSDWESPGFSSRSIAALERTFRDGAVGVKIYKTIGMYLKSASGRYVMPDDPAFAPILEAIAAHDKTVYAHIAEPIGAWKPLDPNDPDSSYYKENPGWHMYGHPERPSKPQILAARDRMLGLHPKLRVVGCHLGSMEEDVADIAARFDRHPNFAVDTSARVTHLALQDRGKVRAFLLKYQDRVLYATDHVILPGDDVEAKRKRWEADLLRDWDYFATAGPVEYMGRSVAGLSLPEPVLRKLYRDNALRWVPGLASPQTRPLTLKP